MRNLVDKYDLRTFEDFVGQGDAVRTARGVAISAGGAVLLAGPSGAGKTALGLVIGASFLCSRRAVEGSPCGSCRSCQQIRDRTSLDMVHLSAGSKGGVDAMATAAELITTPSFARRVFFIDEAQEITGAGQGALLVDLERIPEGVLVIFATDRPGRLPARFLDRSPTISLATPSRPDLMALCTDICRREDLPLSTRDRKILVRAAGGSFRGLLRAIGDCVVDDRLDTARYANKHVLAGFEYLAMALRAEPISTQIRLVNTWPATPSKVRTVVDVFEAILSLSVTDDQDVFGFCEVDDVALADTVRRLRHLHQGQPASIDELSRYWADHQDRSTLPIWMITGFADLVTRLSDRDTTASAPRFRRQSAPQHDPSQFLPCRAAVQLWDSVIAATELDGALLNTTVVLKGVGREPAVRAAVSDLTHELGLYCRRHGAEPFRWAVTYSAPGGDLVANIGLSLPTEILDSCAAWARGKFAVAQAIKDRQVALTWQHWRETANSQRSARQVAILRQLCTELDPCAVARCNDGTSVPVHQLLGIARGGGSAVSGRRWSCCTTLSQIIRRPPLNIIRPLANGLWNQLGKGHEIEQFLTSHRSIAG